MRAKFNLRRICDEYLGHDYELTLIDIEAHPELAEAANVFATPLTVRVSPLPVSRVVGDLSDSSSVLMALGISTAATEASSKQG